MASSGLHANGYSLVRHILTAHAINLDATHPEEASLKTSDAVMVENDQQDRDSTKRLNISALGVCLHLSKYIFDHLSEVGVSKP